MNFSIQSFLELWAPGRQVTDLVVELFSLIGRDLTERELSAAVEQSQMWLRPEDKERWDIPVGRPDDMDRMVEILTKLGIYESNGAEAAVFDEAIILGSTSYSMEELIGALLESPFEFGKLTILGSAREIGENHLEVEHLDQYPEYDGKHTETTAAFYLLAAHIPVLQERGDVPSLQVIHTPNHPDGKRASMVEIIETWRKQAVEFDYKDNRRPRYLFISHQPFGPRQAITVHRCLRGYEFDYDFFFGWVSDRMQADPHVLVDVAARTLYEIMMIAEEFYD